MRMGTELSHIKPTLAFSCQWREEEMFPFCSGLRYGGRGAARMERASVLCKDKGVCSAWCWEKSLLVYFPLILSAFEYKVHCSLGQDILEGLWSTYETGHRIWYCKTFRKGGLLYKFALLICQAFMMEDLSFWGLFCSSLYVCIP